MLLTLINPKSSLTGLSPQLKKTKHWYLKLDDHQSFLEDWILKSHKSTGKRMFLGKLNHGLTKD